MKIELKTAFVEAMGAKIKPWQEPLLDATPGELERMRRSVANPSGLHLLMVRKERQDE